VHVHGRNGLRTRLTPDKTTPEPIVWAVGGSLILADIHFNGAGVKHNIPLAMRFACESEEGMAKLGTFHSICLRLRYTQSQRHPVILKRRGVMWVTDRLSLFAIL
jgi:hypothetical protein